MKKNKIILGVLFVFLKVYFNAQSNSKYEINVKDACNFDISLINKTVYGFNSDIEAEGALQKIMRLVGLPANFEIRAASVPNAAAFVDCDTNGNCKRYILYNQEFMENLKNETSSPHAEYAVLCHEIGHHLSGHTITNSGKNYDLELEADKFAGFMLFKLGLTIDEAKKTYSNLPISGSTTHPPKDARMAALTNGWYDAKRNGVSSVNSAGSQTTTQTTTQSSNLTDQKLTIYSTTFDFGKIKFDSPGISIFKMKNISSRNLTVVNAKSSCGCLVPEWPNSQIISGEEFIIRARYDTRRPGLINKTITIQILWDGDINPTPYLLSVKGEVLN
jgi:hypothetical protein